MSDSYVPIATKAGTLYIHPVGNDDFAHLYVTTNPDGGGPIGQSTSITIRGVSYTVSAHPHVNADGTLADWARYPGGTIKREGIYISRKGHFSNNASESAWNAARVLIEDACKQYLARPEAAQEIREARAESLRMRIESLERDENEAQEKLDGIRDNLKTCRAALRKITGGKAPLPPSYDEGY